MMNVLKRIGRDALILFLLLSVSGCGEDVATVQGYLDTRLVYVSAQYNGLLNELQVKRGQAVQRGQSLFVLDQQPEAALLDGSTAQFKRATLEENIAKNDLDYARTIYNRRAALLKKNVLDQESMDSAKNRYENALQNFNRAHASLSAAQAELDRANWAKKTKTVSSMIAGEIYDTYYQPGELVLAGQAILSILDPDELRVIFYLPERDLVKVKLRDRVSFKMDGSTTIYYARVNYIASQAEYTPPVIYSDERKQKLVFRVEAAPSKNDISHLHPGQPVSVQLIADQH